MAQLRYLFTGCIRNLNRRPLPSPRCRIFPCLGCNLFGVHHPIVAFSPLSDSCVSTQWEDLRGAMFEGD
jgi:hypothetical protein